MAALVRRPSLLVNGLPSTDSSAIFITPIEPKQTQMAYSPPQQRAAAAAAAASQSQATSATESDEPTITPLPDRSAAKLNMLKRMRPPPFQYAWTFWHDRHADSNSYDGRLTVLLENIITLKPFWEAYNRFPLEALKLKDSIHFFKRGVRPVWEDPRNVKGGAWTFRVSKDKSEQMWKEILLLAVGEQFADVISKGDDLCGVSLSVRFNSMLIMIWNRRADCESTITGIKDVVHAKLSPDVRPKEGSCVYKRHSEHAGFNEAVAQKVMASGRVTMGKIEEATVQEGEVEAQEGA